MAIKVVTDSTSDIPLELAQELGLTIVPVYVRFGHTIYRDRIDITPRQFYEMLSTSPYHPASSQPTPEDFTRCYEELGGDAEGIVSIHLSSKISGTYNSACIASKNLASNCPIEVIDSGTGSAGLALVATAAARAAREGKGLASVLAEAKKAMNQTKVMGVFESMKYLARSGRVNKSIGAASQILNIVPLLTFRDGEVVRSGLARNISRGIDRLYEFVEARMALLDVVIAHSNIPERAEQLKRRLGWLFPEDAIRIFDIGAGIGVHIGPGCIIIGVREDI